MLKKSMILLFTAVFLVISISAVGAANLNSVTYSISGDASDVDTLELEPEFMINNIHPAKLNLAFDGDDFYFGANMGLNMLMEDNFRLDLNLMLTNEVDGLDFGKAFGLAAATRGADLSFFWQTYYFIDDDLDDHAYYKGGANYRIGPRSDLEISVANQYWDLDNDVIKLGIKVKL
jgi:hypothetical protein